MGATNKVVPLTQPSFSGKMPRKPLNAEVRSREYLTEDEVEALIKAAKQTGRHGHRDGALILMMYRHGLRVSEVIALRWDQVDFKKAKIHINRLKNGEAATHPIRGPVLRALRKLQRDYLDSQYLFQTERGGPLTDSTVRKMVARAGREAGLSFSVHPHMLRHACGFKLANDGHDTRAIQDYLGHRNIQHTVRYTKLTSTRFNDFWRD